MAPVPAGFAGRTNAAWAWSGSALFVQGGATTSKGAVSDGAYYVFTTDIWVDLPAIAKPRSEHSGVWTGDRFIVWGGIASDNSLLNDGLRYDAASAGWSSIATAPLSKRKRHAAVWSTTTKQMLVWGGLEAPAPSARVLDDGAAYDPATDSWSPLPPPPIEARYSPHSFWTGTEWLVWGGHDVTNREIANGARYDPKTRTWSKLPTLPFTWAPRVGSSVAFADGRLFVWGGQRTSDAMDTSDGVMFDLTKPTAWSAMPPLVATTATDPARNSAVAWAGTGRFYAWSGLTYTSKTEYKLIDTGASYDPVTSTWSALPVVAAPTPRAEAITVWTGEAAIVWGGNDGVNVLNDGAIYVP